MTKFPKGSRPYATQTPDMVGKTAVIRVGGVPVGGRITKAEKIGSGFRVTFEDVDITQSVDLHPRARLQVIA